MRKRPLVVFLDSYSWQAFVDLAGALRQHKVRVARITGRSSSVRVRLIQRMESWVFGPLRRGVVGGVLHGSQATIDPIELAAAVPADAVDVQMQEDLVLSALGLTDGPADPTRHLAADIDPLLLVDKRLQAEHARGIGVPVPGMWDTPTATRYPVVVKTPVGFGGGGVRVVRDAAALAEAWTDFSANGVRPFVQEFMARGVSTGGVAVDGEPLICVAYDGRPAADDPTGPSEVIVAVRSDEAVERSATFLCSIGYTGFFCIDWVTDQQGGLRLIDFNARVFGSWVALQELGFDLAGAYVHLLGAGPRPAESRGRYGVAAPLLRYPCPPVDTRDQVMLWRAQTLAVVRARRPWLGARWAAVIRMRTALGTVRALGKVRRQSKSGAGSGSTPRQSGGAAARQSTASAA
jgi:hypothetical protein